MPTEEESREQGVEFGSLVGDLENEEYPMSSEELLEKYGDRTVELQDQDQTIRDIFGPIGEMTFESADDVTQFAIGTVSDEAIGRKGYTDRGGMASEEERDEESL